MEVLSNSMGRKFSQCIHYQIITIYTYKKKILQFYLSITYQFEKYTYKKYLYQVFKIDIMLQIYR